MKRLLDNLPREIRSLFTSVNNRPAYKMNRFLTEEHLVKPGLCSNCGYCCQHCGCAFSPYDFEDLSFQALLDELSKGYISIGLIEKRSLESIKKDILYLRMRNVGASVVDIDRKGRPSACVGLKSDGCMFDFEHRPFGGKYLMPFVEDDRLACFNVYSHEECAKEWEPYQKVLKKLVKAVPAVQKRV